MQKKQTHKAGRQQKRDLHRKLPEKKRIKQESKQTIESAILSAIPHAVVGLRQRKVFFANHALERVFGWKPEEVIGRDTRIFYRTDEEYREIGLHFYPVLEKQKTYSEEFICRRKDGTDILCMVSASVIGRKLKNNEIIVMYEDVTDKKRIEEALLKSERKYLDFYQNAPDGYHSLNPDGTIIEVNDTWLAMLGYEREEIINRVGIADLLTDEGQKKFQKSFQVLREKGSIENVEHSMRKRDGTFLPVLINATAIYDGQGNFMQTRTIVRDISARIGYRERLEQTIEEWRKTFDSMPYGVLFLDLDFKITRANKYFSVLYETDKDITDKKCYEVIKSDQLSERYHAFRTTNTISLDSFEYSDPRLNRYFMVYMTPIPDAEGITRNFVLALVDITDIKDKEKSLTDSRDAFFNMLKELDYSYKELKVLYEGLILSFVNAIDAKSPWTKGHSERVTRYALSIAREMGLEDETMENLRIAALLHDIGKIGTYDIILDNPQKLSPEEIKLINLHPIKGEQILRPIKQLQHLLPIIRHHHERVDGKGYPDGLKGADIPLLSRIICVADAFDSMTSDRPYRPSGSEENALLELQRCSRSQFDPLAVGAFLRVFSKEREEENITAPQI